MATKKDKTVPGPGQGQLDGLTKGSRLWYKKDQSTWLQAELAGDAEDATVTIQVLGANGAPSGAPTSVARDLLAPANPSLQDGIPDVVQLSYLTEPGILYNLGHRCGTRAAATSQDHVLIVLLTDARSRTTWTVPRSEVLRPCLSAPLGPHLRASGIARPRRTTQLDREFHESMRPPCELARSHMHVTRIRCSTVRANSVSSQVQI